MKKQAKPYPSPESQELTDKLFESAKQWCELDKKGGRGAMIMLTDEKGTHYMFTGNAEANTLCAIDIISARDMEAAGRMVQITFLWASNFVAFDKTIRRLGITDFWDKSEEERQSIVNETPELTVFIERKKRLTKELERYGKESC